MWYHLGGFVQVQTLSLVWSDPGSDCLRKADSHQKDPDRATDMVSSKTICWLRRTLLSSTFFLQGRGHEMPDSNPQLLDEIEWSW